MRERLIELLDNFGDDISLCDVCKRPSEDCEGCKNEQLADYLIANGVIVPPCKVGDTVYVVSQGAGFSLVWRVYKATATAIHLDRRGTLFIRVETDKVNVGGYVEIERVFLTKEEAEKALKEREGI